MFKKKFILFVVLIFISQPSFAENKIAFIDIELLLSKSIPSKNMLDQLKKFEDNKLVEFEKKEKVLKDNENKIISTKNLISKEEYNKKVKIFKDQIKDYQNSKNDINKDFENMIITRVAIVHKKLNEQKNQTSFEKEFKLLVEKRFTSTRKKLKIKN